MMNLPEGAQLLSIARQTLLAELLPLVEGDRRYTLLMVANAMAIAARELEDGGRSATSELNRLDALYARPARELHGTALREAVDEAERELARDIRSGVFDSDPSRRDTLLRHLRESVVARLKISSPKSLKS
jgi:hypothetical protein